MQPHHLACGRCAGESGSAAVLTGRAAVLKVTLGPLQHTAGWRETLEGCWCGHRGTVTQGFTYSAVSWACLSQFYNTVFLEDLYKTPAENSKIKLSKRVLMLLKEFATDTIRSVNTVI